MSADIGAQISADLQKTIDRLLAEVETLRVLEAGCGSASHVDFPPSRWLVGIDLSEKQLALNPSLDERILGDIQTYDYEPNSFDVVVCWNVLEHVREPEEALRRFFRAIKPGGIAVLACPNPRSVKGLVTRLTPHRFHVWFYRRILGSKLAGTDDHGPFPTIMSRDIAPEMICATAAAQGLKVEFCRGFDDFYNPRAGRRFARLATALLHNGVRVLMLLVQIASLGNLGRDPGESRIVLRKEFYQSSSDITSSVAQM